MQYNRCVVHLPGIYDLCRHVSVYCETQDIPHDAFVVLNYVKKLFDELLYIGVDEAALGDDVNTLTYALFNDSQDVLELIYEQMFNWLTVLGIPVIDISEIIPVSTDGHAIVRLGNYGR